MSTLCSSIRACLGWCWSLQCTIHCEHISACICTMQVLQIATALHCAVRLSSAAAVALQTKEADECINNSVQHTAPSAAGQSPTAGTVQKAKPASDVVQLTANCSPHTVADPSPVQDGAGLPDSQATAVVTASNCAAAAVSQGAARKTASTDLKFSDSSRCLSYSVQC